MNGGHLCACPNSIGEDIAVNRLHVNEFCVVSLFESIERILNFCLGKELLGCELALPSGRSVFE
jgi:hypothetical protein